MDYGKERKSVSSKEREMLICGSELHCMAERGILVEVQHVRTHHTKKEKKDMSQFEKFVIEGNEKANDCAKGAMLDEGFMAEARAKPMQQEREGDVCSFAVCGQASTARYMNGKIVKSSGSSRKKSGFSLKRRARIRCIEQNGVRKQISIGA